eukprot:7275310-Prymnesium_polylepis.2
MNLVPRSGYSLVNASSSDTSSKPRHPGVSPFSEAERRAPGSQIAISPMTAPGTSSIVPGESGRRNSIVPWSRIPNQEPGSPCSMICWRAPNLAIAMKAANVLSLIHISEPTRRS